MFNLRGRRSPSAGWGMECCISLPHRRAGSNLCPFAAMTKWVHPIHTYLIWEASAQRVSNCEPSDLRQTELPLSLRCMENFQIYSLDSNPWPSWCNWKECSCTEPSIFLNLPSKGSDLNNESATWYCMTERKTVSFKRESELFENLRSQHFLSLSSATYVCFLSKKKFFWVQRHLRTGETATLFSR